MAEMRSSNPVFSRGGFTGRHPQPAPVPVPEYGAGGHPLPGAGAPLTPTPEQLAGLYRAPSGLTVDDVVIHTLGLFAVTAITGVAGWAIAPAAPMVGFVAMFAALALSFVISFSRRLRPSLIVVFAALEGLFVGAVSRYFEDAYSGIVLQALLGTGLVFVAMLVAYRSGRLRATPRMARIVYGSLLGVILLGLSDLVIRAVSGSHLPVINDASPLGILFSVAVLVVASLQFILDFDYIERAIASGAPREESWRAAFGLIVGFVWVYLEMLRLLSKLRA
ncbi:MULTISPECIES: Bax inhibitor-1/YccA family protein [unclassified Frankia]|uniref:Bax inhibitor-1/YccA family protein n=1 Tax=unclassified Frankia TaxID=2632575 RepID=UPI001EF63364|nr:MULTISPECIES: Bax inhibitor-1/YccA family protein [unclassified Frankia]